MSRGLERASANGLIICSSVGTGWVGGSGWRRGWGRGAPKLRVRNCVCEGKEKEQKGREKKQKEQIEGRDEEI